MIWLRETDSTNEEIKRRAGEDAPDGLWVVADRQTRGRGRRGRSWESANEGNLYMSLLLRPVFPKESASMVTLVMALSVASVIREMTGLDAKIKWPRLLEFLRSLLLMKRAATIWYAAWESM